jgi:hypothetical protein
MSRIFWSSNTFFPARLRTPDVFEFALAAALAAMATAAGSSSSIIDLQRGGAFMSSAAVAWPHRALKGASTLVTMFCALGPETCAQFAPSATRSRPRRGTHAATTESTT